MKKRLHLVFDDDLIEEGWLHVMAANAKRISIEKSFGDTVFRNIDYGTSYPASRCLKVEPFLSVHRDAGRLAYDALVEFVFEVGRGLIDYVKIERGEDTYGDPMFEVLIAFRPPHNTSSFKMRQHGLLRSLIDAHKSLNTTLNRMGMPSATERVIAEGFEP